MDNQYFLRALLETKEGKSALAQSMMAPLRKRMDYEGLARKIFSVKGLCVVCQTFSDLIEVPINLDLEADCISPGYSRMFASNEPAYCVCKKCLKKSKKQIRKIKRMDPKSLPLHISDPNIFVREAAVKRLEKCQSQN